MPGTRIDIVRHLDYAELTIALPFILNALSAAKIFLISIIFS